MSALPLLLPLVLQSASLQATDRSPYEHAPPDRPNFIVVVLDDVGIEQLASYSSENLYADPAGYPYASTPTLDALASRGVCFDQARAMPKCSPTRAAILTGRYPASTGQGEIATPAFRAMDFVELNVPPAPVHPPLPFLLKVTGYETAAIGKWHLGLDVEPGGMGGTMDEHPMQALGFDEWQGTPRNIDGAGTPPGSSYFSFEWSANGTRTTVQGEYATTYTVDRTIEWFQGASEPFFLWVGLNACHMPLDTVNWPPGELHGFGGRASGSTNTVFRACLEATDKELGRLFDGIPAELRDDTLVIVIGDNGSEPFFLTIDPFEVRYPAEHPLHEAGDNLTGFSSAPYLPHRSKGTVYEAGVRVPLIVGTLPLIGKPNQADALVAINEHHAGLVDAVDLYATLLELAGLGNSTPNSISFAPALLAPDAPGQRPWSLVQSHRPNGREPHDYNEIGFIREAGNTRWKLHRRQNGGDPYVWEFYDLTNDPLELVDLGQGHPEFTPTRIEMQTVLLSDL